MSRSPLVVVVVVAVLAVTLGVPLASGATSDPVISQVFASGGNAGADFTNDYVELVNRGGTSVDLGGWSIQYATASGTSWSAVALSGTLGPGRRYLVQLGSGGTVGSPLPAPDATATVNLAATGGKVALVHDTAALVCGTTAGNCSAVATVRDLVGYGSATDYEGAGPAPALTSATALVRASDGCTDGNANGADFGTAVPAPHNSSATAVSCGASSSGSSGGTATVDLDVQPVVSLTLDRPSVSFGSVASGVAPAPVAERVTVASSGSTGYVLSVHRTAFTPVDLPLVLSATAPAGTQLAAPLAGGALLSVPVAPAADLLIGASTAASALAGDVWPTTFAFRAPFPTLAPGHYASSVTYTVIAL